jgi:hypothetical protein
MAAGIKFQTIGALDVSIAFEFQAMQTEPIINTNLALFNCAGDASTRFKA